MADPDFSPSTRELIAYRASYICCNPDCNCLTVGPSFAVGELKLKIGEAVHIAGAREGTARYDSLMTKAGRADAKNGIWLCASCHTLVDKNGGADFPIAQVREWKEKHEHMIGGLLRTHRSAMPLVRRHSSNQAIAQEVVDTLSGKGAFFQDYSWEEPSYVLKSVEQTRYRLSRLRTKVELDSRLREIIENVLTALREFMNETSIHSHHSRELLDVLRRRIGTHLRSFRDEYGCAVSGPITRIMH